MFNVECNIDRTDRNNRIVIGVLLILGALIGLGKFFLITVGAILIVEGVVGWCGIPVLMAKMKEKIKNY